MELVGFEPLISRIGVQKTNLYSTMLINVYIAMISVDMYLKSVVKFAMLKHRVFSMYQYCIFQRKMFY